MKNKFLFWVAVAIATVSLIPRAYAAPNSARRWKVIVIVPEQHIARPRIPDPAVETSISRQLIDAGYKVVDQDRIKDLRYSAVMDRILAGGPGALKEIIQLKRRFGADILVTGEAFTQEVSRRIVETDLGNSLQIRCRARVELKAIRMDTGEKIYADSIQKTGPQEPTVELSSKACLEDAADHVGPSLLDKLGKLSIGGTQSVEVEIRNVPSFTRANEIKNALAAISGIKQVDPGEFDARTLFTEVTVDKTLLPSLAARIESSPTFKKFRLQIQSASGSKIIAVCK